MMSEKEKELIGFAADVFVDTNQCTYKEYFMAGAEFMTIYRKKEVEDLVNVLKYTFKNNGLEPGSRDRIVKTLKRYSFLNSGYVSDIENHQSEVNKLKKENEELKKLLKESMENHRDLQGIVNKFIRKHYGC